MEMNKKPGKRLLPSVVLGYSTIFFVMSQWPGHLLSQGLGYLGLLWLLGLLGFFFGCLAFCHGDETPSSAVMDCSELI
jgi:hypothetical protein